MGEPHSQSEVRPYFPLAWLGGCAKGREEDNCAVPGFYAHGENILVKRTNCREQSKSHLRSHPGGSAIWRMDPNLKLSTISIRLTNRWCGKYKLTVIACLLLRRALI